MTKNTQLEKLYTLGQSVWYDNLSRDVLRSGELKSLIDSGVTGLTSNPTIFKKAIADTADYDHDIKKVAGNGSGPGMSTEELCEELMVQDVAAASDLLLPIYKSTGGVDGYASIEVSPYLARDSQTTIAAAKRIWSKLNRPNIMIKIPGTPECLPAICDALEAGMNVNVTLLFNVQMYEAVVEQYITALEKRVAQGKAVKEVASVASFFVSRVDAICEKNFDALVKSGKAKETDMGEFFGKVGTANARLTYVRFMELFSSERFKKLAAQGARVQRPLWASTGTKNPKLNPLLYVEELAGKDTVNTMPPATLNILLEGGVIENRIGKDITGAKSVLQAIARLGMNFDSLMRQLQDDGVKLFADAYKELLDSVETKRQAVQQGGQPSQPRM